MRHAIVLLALTIGLPLPGQDRAVAAPKPTKPLLVLEMDGPDALRETFLPTNLGTMLASEDARKIWPELWDRFHSTWYGKEGEEPLMAYGGRIRVLAFVQPGPPQRERGMVLFEPDDETSLTQLGGELSTFLRSTARGRSVEREAAGLELETVSLDTPGTTTLPMVLEGRLVSFFGRENELEWVVAEGLRSLAALPPVAEQAPPFSFRLDLAQVADLARADAVGSEEMMEELYGLASLEELAIVVRPAGPRVSGEVSVRFGDGNRGIFAGLMPEIGEPPALASLVPAESEWLAGPLDLDSLVRTAVTFLTLAFRHGAAPADPLAEARAGIRQELGFDLFDDLLGHLGREVMVLGRPGSMDPAPRIDDFFSGLCLGVSVRKHELVETNLLRLLGKMDLRGMGRVREYRGVEVRELPFPDGSAVAYLAVAPELLLLAFDDEGLELLEGVLAARGSGGGDVPADVRKVSRQAPPGWNGMGRIRLRTAIGFGLPVLGEWMGFRTRGIGSEAPLELLERYGLGQVVVFTGYREGRWYLRALW